MIVSKAEYDDRVEKLFEQLIICVPQALRELNGFRYIKAAEAVLRSAEVKQIINSVQQLDSFGLAAYVAHVIMIQLLSTSAR